MEEKIKDVKAFFDSGETLSVDFRIQQLKILYKLVKQNQDDLVKAVHADLHKNEYELLLTELHPLLDEIMLHVNNLKKWNKPEYVAKGSANILDSAFIYREPKGVVLIIAPWNYPIRLLLLPLVGVISAGNCAILKPSEFSPSTSTLLSSLIEEYFCSSFCIAFPGDKSVSEKLLTVQFDHIMFTGSTSIGKCVMKAASQNLTPLTLELGGKCSVLVCDDKDVREYANRIAWGKFLNAGQTCLAPDYVLCAFHVKEAFVDALKTSFNSFVEGDSSSSTSYARIINATHFDRLTTLLSSSSGKVIYGGSSNKNDLFFEPTLVENVNFDDSLMSEEIFGPLLPILEFTELEQAVKMVKEGKSKPLATYIFSSDQASVDFLLKNVSSGSVCINDTIMQASLTTLPFGGVGMSGMGRYNGKFSFLEFSNDKAVLQRSLKMQYINGLRYPPYTCKKFQWLSWLIFQKHPNSLF